MSVLNRLSSTSDSSQKKSEHNILEATRRLVSYSIDITEIATNNGPGNSDNHQWHFASTWNSGVGDMVAEKKKIFLDFLCQNQSQVKVVDGGHYF